MTDLERGLELPLASHDIPHFHDLRTLGWGLFTTRGATNHFYTSIIIIALLFPSSLLFYLYFLFSIFVAVLRQPVVFLARSIVFKDQIRGFHTKE